EPRRSKVHRAMEWLKPSSAPSSVTMSASVRARMQTPSCTSCQLGSLTTTRFTRTRRSDIVHPVSSSQLTETRDRVRSFGGYNTIQDRKWSISIDIFSVPAIWSPSQLHIGKIADSVAVGLVGIPENRNVDEMGGRPIWPNVAIDLS